MALINEGMLKLQTKKNRIDLSCPKFLDDLCKKDEALDIGKFNINVQLILNGVESIDGKLEKLIQKETAKIMDASAGRIAKLVGDLKTGVKDKQSKDKSGDDKAGKEAADLTKKLGDQITTEMNSMGGVVRKQIDAILKKQGIKGKLESVSRNHWKKAKLESKAFKGGTGEPAVDAKTMSSLGGDIENIAFAKGHKLVDEYINTAKAISDHLKGGPDNPEDLKKEIAGFAKTIQTFQKELSQGKALAQATVELKKQKGKPDKSIQELTKHLGTLEKSRQAMASELKKNSSLAEAAMKIINAGKNDRLPALAPMFQTAAKQMDSLSAKNSPIAKAVAKQAKLSAKQG